MFNFCKHKWKIISSCMGKATYFSGATHDITSLLLQCEKCGNVKERTVDGHYETKQKASQ